MLPAPALGVLWGAGGDPRQAGALGQRLGECGGAGTPPPQPPMGAPGRDAGRKHQEPPFETRPQEARRGTTAHLVVEPHVHHRHFSNHLDPAGATGVVRVDASAEPHLGKADTNASWSATDTGGVLCS